MLNSKQIHDRDIAFLSKALAEISAGGHFIHTVNLRDNMITEIGVKTLLRDYITVKDSAGGRRVRTLDLGGNPIGQGGAMLFERCLVGVAGGRCALGHLGLASTGLGPAGVLGVASWLGKAAQLVEVDLRGNGAFGAEAMEALVASMEEHGRVLIKVDDEAKEGLSSMVVWRFEQASRNNVTAAGMDAM
jgi:Ran GTPase-activating protein (RanGAP) involved in mRNA processing and transport